MANWVLANSAISLRDNGAADRAGLAPPEACCWAPRMLAQAIVSMAGRIILFSQMPHVTLAGLGSHPIGRLVLSTAVVLSALGLGGRPAPRVVVVRLEGNAFRPDQIHVHAGDSVK